MDDSSGRFGWLTSLAGILMWAGIALGLFTVYAGIYLGVLRDSDSRFVIALILGGLLTIPVWIGLYGLISLLVRIEDNLQGMDTDRASMLSELRAQRRTLEQMAENILLSDATKAIVYRDKDRQVLRQAVQADIAERHWEAAGHLIDQMENRFGGHEEAARLRQEMQRLRRTTQEQQIVAGLHGVEGLLEDFQWDEARTAIDRLLMQFPEDNRVRSLPDELEDRREKRKRRLLTEFDEAFKRGDVDLAGQLLKQLDAYLTQNEAAALEEAARGVFRAHLHQLGVQFSLAVSEQNWQQALEIGTQIIEQYPNTRFAREVHERVDVLRQRAAEEAQTQAAASG